MKTARATLPDPPVDRIAGQLQSFAQRQEATLSDVGRALPGAHLRTMTPKTNFSFEFYGAA